MRPATVATAVSRTALATVVALLGLLELLGVGVGVPEPVDVGLGLTLGEAGTESDGCGLVLGVRQLGDGDERRTPDPDVEAEWDAGGAGEIAGCPLPGPCCPVRGCTFELLGAAAVETPIAT